MSHSARARALRLPIIGIAIMKLHLSSIATPRALFSAQPGCSCAYRNALGFRSDRHEGGFA